MRLTHLSGRPTAVRVPAALFIALASAGFLLSIVTETGRAQAAEDIVLYAAEVTQRAGSFRVVADSTAAGGSRLEQPNVNAARITTPLANPAHYVEYAITVEAGVPYHLWIRGKALNNSGENDSVWVQASALVDAGGAPRYRIGTTSATMVNLENCSGCRISGWGWQDNGFGTGVPGELLRFASSGAQTLRIQAREDGISIDQIVLSPSTYLNTAPGQAQNDTTILPKSGSSNITLVRGPYLQQVSDSGAIVVWATRQPGPASVVYWTGSQTASTAQASTVFRAASTTGIPDYYQHEATITGLHPATTYQYDLRVHGEDATPGVTDHLKTAPTTGTGTVRFIAFGDSGKGTTAQGQIATRLNSETFDFAVHTGDLVYSSGTYPEFEARYFPYYKAWLRAKAFFPSIGNHDDVTGAATPFRTFFVLPRDGASPAFPNNAERFYSFDYGPIHFIALDTEAAFQSAARRDEQLAWLEADLQQSQSHPWRVVFFHRPPYSAGGEHGSYLPARQVFVPLFERYGVQLVLNGHEHDYERTIPWKENPSPTSQAVTYIVTGGGGAELYPAAKAAWTAFSRSAYHYVRATATTTQISIQTVGVDGAVFDSVVLNR